MSPSKPPRKRNTPAVAAAAPSAKPKPSLAAVPRPKVPVVAAPKPKTMVPASVAPVPTGEQWDLLVRDVRVVRPGKSGAALADIAVRGGKIVRVGRGLPAEHAKHTEAIVAPVPVPYVPAKQEAQVARSDAPVPV
jgi:hypothetical protein